MNRGDELARLEAEAERVVAEARRLRPRIGMPYVAPRIYRERGTPLAPVVPDTDGVHIITNLTTDTRSNP